MQNSPDASAVRADDFASVKKILMVNRNDPLRLVTILMQIQEEQTYLSRETIAFVARSLGLSTAHVYAVAASYPNFSLTPKGKHIIRLCDGTTCHVKSSDSIVKTLNAKLGLSREKRTDDRGLFTLEIVHCLGACGNAPVMVVDGTTYSEVTPEFAHDVVDKILQEESEGAGE